MTSIYRLALIALLSLPKLSATARNDVREAMLERMFSYAASVDTIEYDPTTIYSYNKYSMSVERRNAILMAVPSMYVVAHGRQRQYIGESYNRIDVDENGNFDIDRLASCSTMPHNRQAMTTLMKYLSPHLYSNTLTNNQILSPFNRRNRRFYRYAVMMLHDGRAIVTFTPKLRHTQLVRGTALADAATGRVIEAVMDGEYDMINFHIELVMSDEGRLSLYPIKCNLSSRFSFLGNVIKTSYSATHGIDSIAADNIAAAADTAIMAAVRPEPLTPSEKQMFDKIRQRRDSTVVDTTASHRKEKRLANILWDNIGEHLLNRTRSNFGNNGQGYLRVSPLLNPLYFGYSNKKGIVYKLSFKGNYFFNDESLISLNVKAGYAFKQRQFYFTAPLTYTFSRRRNGYIRLEVGNGNRITNSSVAEDIKHEKTDSIDWSAMNLEYFRVFNLNLTASYDLSEHFGIAAGVVAHKRTAVDKSGFIEAERPTTYTSVAPVVELTYRPLGYGGIVLTADYERCFKGFMGSTLKYERFEADGQYSIEMLGLNSLDLRAGVGFYTNHGDDWIFLDYTNFRENNLPGGWSDDWACDFELLGSNWYNTSEYYVRANASYESPLMLLSWLPLAGRFIEKERIYINALSVQHLHPYVEYGYGFTTRLFSTGIFVAQRNGEFGGFGVRFGFELFRDW